MAKRKIIIITAVLLCAVAGTIPVLLALMGSMQYAEEEQVQGLDEYAAEVMRLTTITKQQLNTVFTDENLRQCPPCSTSSLRKMLELQMSSNLLQSVALIENNHIICTSNGIAERQNLGDPDGITPRGTRSWLNVEFSFAPGKQFNIYERNGFAGVVPVDQSVDIYSEHEHISFAVAFKKPALVLKTRGDFQSAWLDEYLKTGQSRFKTESHWVVVKEHKNILTFAAIPVGDAQLQLTSIAYIVIPFSVLVGLILCVLVLYVARQRLSLKADIKSALKRNEFFMLYQPIINLQTGRVTGAESLIRWRDTDGNFISPEQFIPIAEQAGLISEITETVVELVSHDVEKLWHEYPEFHISINFSSQDMHSHRSVQLIKKMLSEHNVGSSSLIIEVTERGFVDAEKASLVINELHELGVNIAIDDFGTGYSSLSHLESLDLNYLKIDKTFIDTLGTEAATSKVALHIMEMAKSLGLKMVAEGVETELQASLLTEMGVQTAQGWHFGRPMPIGELLTIIQQQG